MTCKKDLPTLEKTCFRSPLLQLNLNLNIIYSIVKTVVVKVVKLVYITKQQ